jgi:polysaccharide pyruvyl transferase WcaK-like protein
MKKIAIFGSYNGTSIGDTAILLGLLSSLEKIYQSDLKVNILVMKPINIKEECNKQNIKININEIVITEFIKPNNYISYIKLFFKKIKNKFFNKEVIKKSTVDFALKDVDYLLIGGGNLIMDLYPQSPQLIKTICDIAISKNVKYSFIGVGAGPLNSDFGRSIFEKYLKQAEYVFLRDKDSLNLLQKKFKNINLFLIPDLALALSNTCKIKKMDRDTLLINVASVYGQGWPIEDNSKFLEYIKNMVEVTRELILSEQFKKIKLFYSNYPLDTQGGEVFIDELRKYNIQVEVINKALTVSEIISLANGSKLTFVTRLHAGIMAYHGGSTIVAVAYQPKVKNVLKESGISNYIYDIEFKNKNKITQKIIDSLNKKTIINNKINIENINTTLIKILESK